ncbi:MAG: metallophosphoesterase [Steroidobacteraceae bacterium]
MSDEPFVVAQISDTHFGTVEPEVRAGLLADLARDPPQVIILTGDVTQRARESQFAEAREFLTELPGSSIRLALPGNHDIALFDIVSRAFTPYRLFQRYVSAELEPVFEHARLSLTCVDATRRWRHTNGTLARAQIERVATRLQGTRADFRIVATHQPLVARVASDVKNVARGAAPALERWIGAGADLFIGGHIHLPYCLPVAMQDNSRGSVVLQSGTSLSTRIRSGIPNSYNRIELIGSGDARCMNLERRDFNRETQHFAHHSAHRATIGTAGWELETAH